MGKGGGDKDNKNKEVDTIMKKTSDNKDEKKKDAGSADIKLTTKKSKKPRIPPLEAAAYRLERMLGGSGGVVTTATRTTKKSSSSDSNDPAAASDDDDDDDDDDYSSEAGINGNNNNNDGMMLTSFDHYYANPVKVVRRWLGTSSGGAGKATYSDIQKATIRLLDPKLIDVVSGRELILSSIPAESCSARKSGVSENDDDDDAMETDDDPAPKNPPPAAVSGKFLSMSSARQVESWLISLLVRLLWRDGKYHEAFIVIKKGIDIINKHIQQSSLHVSTATSSTTTNQKKNGITGGSSTGGSVSSLYPLLARMFRYQSLVAESFALFLKTAKSDNNNNNNNRDQQQLQQRKKNLSFLLNEQLRIEWTKEHNVASLRRDIDTQATLLNCLLRMLIQNSQIEQANKLLQNSTFPGMDGGGGSGSGTSNNVSSSSSSTTTALNASNNQLCRYLYYSGVIQALRLEYTLAYSNLSQSLRKSPTNTGIGFRISVQRLLVVVQLLMGEIPKERNIFFQKYMQTELYPYLQITQAVRNGDLTNFKHVITKHKERLQLDNTYTLISRLEHQVVKAGLRKLHISYSRLSLSDVAQRLGLPNAVSAEYVVSKAIRDGVLDATINHEEQYVQSHDLIDIYSTSEPVLAFNRRIIYCLTTHNDCIRNMRYPPDAYKKQLEASRNGNNSNNSNNSKGGNNQKKDKRKKKDKKNNEEEKTDEEKAKELEDQLDEEF